MRSINSILPTIEKDDLLFFLKNLFSNKDFWKTKILKVLQMYFPSSSVLFFSSGRAALEFVAKNLINEKESTYLQAFTCSAVVYPFLKHRISPIYIDIEKGNFNISAKDLIGKQNPNGKALLIQYTFGLLPSKLDEILAYAKEEKLLIIEDLSHSLGNKYRNEYLGNFGDVAVLSFGRDKTISSVSGGALVIRNKSLEAKLNTVYAGLYEQPLFEKLKLVFYLFFMYFAKNNFHLKITRALIFLLQKTGLLDKALSNKEKMADTSLQILYKYPSMFFPLLYNQLLKLPKLLHVRRVNTEHYNNVYDQKLTGSLLKFPLLVEDRTALLQKHRLNNVYLDTWYGNIIDPVSVNLQNYFYEKRQCPVAEEVAKKIINLPTLWKLGKL